MVQGHSVAVHVYNDELAQMVDWLDEQIPNWGPVPCTSWTREGISKLWRNLHLADDVKHRIPFHVLTENELMVVKLALDVTDHYPMSEHPFQ